MIGLTNITTRTPVINKLKNFVAIINQPMWRIKINMFGLMTCIVLTTLFYFHEQHDMCNFMAISGTMHIVAIVFSLLEHESAVKKNKIDPNGD